MEDDWDLQAVVRGCSAAATTSSCSITTATAATTSCSADEHFFCSFQPTKDNFISFQDLFEPRIGSAIQELQDLYKPFFPKSSENQPSQSTPISPLSVLGGLQDLPQPQVQKRQQPKQSLPTSNGSACASTSPVCGSNGSLTSQTQSPRSKRRKNQLKRVCQVPAEALSSDMWSWRKYGQKPIKGSPFPRGYYRCSTSKGCLARKQVERNRSDPGMFIVTYTAEHNHPMPTHRNSLAGSTRQKPATPPTASGDDTNKPTCSPPASPVATLSPALEKIESSREDREDTIEDEDDDFGVSSMPLDDDFFEGLDELAGPAAGDCFSDHFQDSMQLVWLANNAKTTAAGGG